jgi:ketosteroid isomerase-like protein
VSQENVELVKRFFALVGQGSFDDPAIFSTDLIYRPMATFTESEECRGVEQFRRFHDSFYETWADDFAAEIAGIRDYGDAVSVRVAFSGHARASGIEIADVVFEVFWLRDGLITRIEDFATSAEALKAVGLEEEE